MNILFVCRYNRFRSRVAEAFFNYYNKNKKIHVKSAGTNVDQLGFPIMSGAREALKKLNIPCDLEMGAQQLDSNLINWADKIYVVADDVSLEDIPSKKTIQFNIIDAWTNESVILKTIKSVEKSVKEIISSLK